MGRTLLILMLAWGIAGVALAQDTAAPAGDAEETVAEEPDTEKVPMRTARANAKGNKLATEGHFEEAAEIYREEALRRPENGVLQRNLAGALVRSGAADEGLAAYGQALRFAESPKEKAKALFDLGNALATGGQTQQALESYAAAMMLDPSDMDIKHNFEYLMKQSQEGDPDGEEQGDEQGEDQGEQESEGDEEGEQQQGENNEGQEEQQQEQPQPEPGEEDQQAEDQPQPQPEQGEENPDESMDPEDAKRLLDALLEEEKELQAERQRREQTQDPNVDKDW